MSQKWLAALKINPLPTLLSSDDKALAYFVKRDILEEAVPPIEHVWELPAVKKAFSKQQPDGSWKHHGKETITYPAYHYSLVETWKVYRELVEHYSIMKEHEGAQKACEFLFSCQAAEGDIRPMLANQYATYYTGAILALLIKSGYENDAQVEKGLEWLLSMRQNDGGWTVPILTRNLDKAITYDLARKYAEPIEPDRSKPFSHNWTDMVLRAFAAHPKYRRSKEALQAADLLKSSFFQPDFYSTYQEPQYWVRFQFWWPNLVTALDSLSLMGYSREDADIKKGLDWLVENQTAENLWDLDYSERARDHRAVNRETEARKRWLALSIARIFKRFYE